MGVWLSIVVFSDLYVFGLNNKNYLFLVNLVYYCFLFDVEVIGERDWGEVGERDWD